MTRHPFPGRHLALVAGTVLFMGTEHAIADPATDELFALKIMPLLREKCLACHGNDPAKIKGGLILLSREDMLRGGETSQMVLVPGDAAASDLVAAVSRTREDLRMPPKESDRLSDEEIRQVRDWVNAGAPWPSAERQAEIVDQQGEGVTVVTSGGLSDDWTRRRYRRENLWALQPVRNPFAGEVPPGDTGLAVPHRSAIDQLIRRSVGEGVHVVAPADRRTLIRRATFDLTGLPPTPEELDAFLHDPDSEVVAFARVIERLLASPHYGEHWGRHWLDVVRYADSSGLANDYERGAAWRYRDYVIRAFNHDKPYDRFVREQLAGDELDDSQPAGEHDPELLIAAGFLRLGPWELTGMEVARVARQRYLDDVTDAVGQVFLGQPLQCARCHDHKFDPVPTRDYYGMQAVFATTQLADREVPFLETENTSGFEERDYLTRRRAAYSAGLRELEAKEEAAGRAWAAERGLTYIPRGRGLRDGVAENLLPPKHAGFSVEDFGRERIYRKGIERLRWQLDRYEPVACSVYSGATPALTAVYQPLRLPADRLDGEVEETAILAGGDPFSPLHPVRPGVLSAVASLNPAMQCELTGEVSGRRLQLADWIASRANPLTARVMVNRIWQWHFGHALAGNPNNLGATGRKPTHSELLDWLALTFMERGWSVKEMHRVIMMSEAYRRGTAGNSRLDARSEETHEASYASFPPRRLTAEELRDALLAVSGELNPVPGGIPNRPEINPEAALQPRMVMGTFADAWQPNPLPAQRHRRSVYALKLRGLADPFLEVFNQPSPDLTCERRESSTVSPQVFSLFNSAITLDRAVAFAVRLTSERRAPPATVRRAFLLAYGREPEAEELKQCLDHWRKMTVRHRAIDMPDPGLPAEVAREVVEENTGERFRFVERLEFHEDFVPDRKMADVDPETRGLAELCLVLFNANEFLYVY